VRNNGHSNIHPASQNKKRNKKRNKTAGRTKQAAEGNKEPAGVEEVMFT